MAFLKFQRSNCEAVVMEVGLGGRLDATNVINEPALSVITSVQLDHTKILGETKEKIAVEKAGIMKNNIPTLAGPDLPFHVLQVL